MKVRNLYQKTHRSFAAERINRQHDLPVLMHKIRNKKLHDAPAIEGNNKDILEYVKRVPPKHY